jgi:hypothetical protein
VVGVLSNGEIVNVPGPPDAGELGCFTRYRAPDGAADPAAATHEDASGYEIERKASADGDGAWAKIRTLALGRPVTPTVMRRS